jgi:hypothetical protein
MLPSAQTTSLDTTVQIVAVIVTALLFLLVLELVRRRQLVERYALLWMLVAATLLVLAIWTDLLNWASELVGIVAPANFLFLAALGVIFVLLLHFSVATSRLSEETKILAQEVARLDSELRAARANGAPPNGDRAVAAGAETGEAAPVDSPGASSGAASGPAPAEEGQHEPPVEPQGSPHQP